MHSFLTLSQFSLLFKSKLMENIIEITFIKKRTSRFNSQLLYPFFFYLIGKRFDRLTEKWRYLVM